MKVKSIKLENFKQFNSFGISCRESNILVGPNNAGKSTILDALRICGDVLKYASRRKPEIESHDHYGVCATFNIPHSNIGLSIENISRNYVDDDAEVLLRHDNGNDLFVRLHPDRPVKAFLRTEGALPRSTNMFRQLFPLDIVVVPTLGPIEGRENFVTDDTVRRNENTRLSSRSFRNIWYRKGRAEFDEFSKLISLAWPNIEILFPEIVGHINPFLMMNYKEDKIEREVFWSGFGFQVWMQMMSQIMRGTRESILVLDEPDIYLHPDLQRKLLKIVRDRFGQIFIATHSAEIINEANAGDILSVSGKSKNAKRVSSDDDYGEVFKYIGSSENAEFARLARAKRIVFFEGDDKRILRKFAGKVSRSEILDDVDTVFLKAGGFGQWRRVKEVDWTLENVFGMDVKIVSIFDRDYRSTEEIDEFIEKISSAGVKCFVLYRKEIENYALVADVIVRTVLKRVSAAKREILKEDVLNIIDDIIANMKNEVWSQIVANILKYRKKKEPNLNDATILAQSEMIFNRMWDSRERRLMVIPGKEFISALSAKIQSQFGCSVTISQLISEMKKEEVPSDLIEIIEMSEKFFK